MAGCRTTTQVLGIISHLGGPKCSPEELSWAEDIPAGKQLLEWLANQTTHDMRQDDSEDDAISREDHLAAFLAPISLYQDELDIISRITLRDTATGKPPTKASTVWPPSYEPPHQLQARTRALDDEAALLEAQATQLKHRLTASKAAAKDLKKSIHALRSQIQAANSNIQEQQQRLTETSVEADASVSGHVQLATRILEEAAPKDSSVLDDARTRLASLTTSRASAANATRHLYQALDDVYNTLPSLPELQQDAALVQMKLRETCRDSEHLAQAAYVEELERMVREIERGADITALLRARVEAKAEGTLKVLKVDVDVKNELERAGRTDRLVLLEAQEKGLDTIIEYMREDVLTPLQNVYDVLQARTTVASEAEAVMSALIEELEDINDSVESTKQSKDILVHQDEEEPQDVLETEITRLLKRVLGEYSDCPNRNGDRPMVLLNRADIDAELSALSSRLSSARIDEEKWTGGLRARIDGLSSISAPLLTAAYSNALVNTSPPFAPLVEHTALRDKARGKADELTASAAQLQKDAELSSRDKRKLSAFVEKWTQRK